MVTEMPMILNFIPTSSEPELTDIEVLAGARKKISLIFGVFHSTDRRWSMA